MIEDQEEVKENVAEELTDWNEVDVSPSSEKEKIEFEIEDAVEEVKEAAPVEAKEEQAKETLPELDGIETKGAEKRIRQLVKQKNEREERIAQLESERQGLIETVNARDKNSVDIHKNTYDATEQQLQKQTELAKQSYLSAYDAGDKEKMLEAQEILSKSQLDLNNVEQNRSQLAQYERTLEEREQRQKQQQVQQQTQQQQQQQSQSTEYDPQAVEWSKRPENKWFGSDNIMTVAALTIDAQLKEEGYNPSSDDFYSEVDSRMRHEFPHKFNQEAPVKRNTQQVVAGQSRSSSPGSSSKKVKLTQADVKLAQKWNIPLEKYAAEKARADRAAGEYVPIG
tara:strand:+ start:108 stop:1124 length:1017 start_codon:yes stop_codon:yes gene_type:complete